MDNQNINTTTYIRKLILLTFGLLALWLMADLLIASYITYKTPISVNSEVELEVTVAPSYLYCANERSTDAKLHLESVRGAYGEFGDEVAFAVAEVLINDGLCEYSSESLLWLTTGIGQEEYVAYEEVPCDTLKNEHCISVQPVFVYDADNDSITSSGYLLVEPLVPAGSITPPLTEASRLENGLIVNLNY